MDQDRRSALIERYKQGAQTVLDSLEGAGDEELDRRPVDGGWTLREIVHHLADSEMTSAIRIRRILVEDNPTIPGYDEMEFARRLAYLRRPIEPALRAVAAARDTTAQILGLLREEDWSRGGTHTESGWYTAESWLETYAVHAHDHAGQILRARAAAES